MKLKFCYNQRCHQLHPGKQVQEGECANVRKFLHTLYCTSYDKNG